MSTSPMATNPKMERAATLPAAEVLSESGTPAVGPSAGASDTSVDTGDEASVAGPFASAGPSAVVGASVALPDGASVGLVWSPLVGGVTSSEDGLAA